MPSFLTTPWPGFVPGSRATLMMDVVAVGVLAVIPLLTLSIWLVKYKRSYRGHKAVQIALSSILLVVIIGFEVEVRLHGWTHNAVASPYYTTWLFPLLYVHLTAAISTTVLWTLALVLALRRFPSPVRPSAYSAKHRRLAWVAAGLMYATSVTGWSFFYAAFVAT